LNYEGRDFYDLVCNRRDLIQARRFAFKALLMETNTMKTTALSAVLDPEDEGYVSLCPELDIASQGDTIEEAITNLKDAVEGFFETASSEEVRTRLRRA
jgi:predicted RNase H-like HicB family nuclease